jgi:hypothetical protein
VSRYIYISEEYYRLEEVVTKKKQLICIKHSRVYNTIDFLGWNHGSNKAKKKKNWPERVSNVELLDMCMDYLEKYL